MRELRVLELFGGIGACTQAFQNLKIRTKVVDYVEINKFAVNAYNAINDTTYKPQDITEWDKDLEVDFIMHGSPCQDFSVAGLGKGASEDGGTRSSLMYETIRIVDKIRPKYVLWENVKNVLSKKHRHNFDNYLSKMEELGYHNYYQVLNAKDYGVPQNRERIFVLSCLEDIEYKFPEKQELTIRLKDILEDEVEEKYYISSDKVEKLIKQIVSKGDLGKLTKHCTIREQTGTFGGNYISPKDVSTGICSRDYKGPVLVVENIEKSSDDIEIGALINQATSTGSIYCKNGGVLNTSYPDSDTRRGRVISDGDVCGTIECANHIGRLEIEKVLVDDTVGTLTTDSSSPKHNNRICQVYPILTLDRLEKRQNGRRCKEDDEPMFTLTGQDRHGVVLMLSENDYILVSIRKLTPNECWRLMGFTDDVFELAEQVNSNSQLYKQAGNSIVVDVLVAILGQLRLSEA